MQNCTFENTPTFGILNGYRTFCKVLRIHDGDTLWIAFCNADQICYKIKIRMAGYDSAEIHSSTEKSLAQQATETLEKLIHDAGADLMVEFLNPDKYGRTLARLFTKNGLVCLNEQMISLKMGVQYDGGTKPISHYKL